MAQVALARYTCEIAWDAYAKGIFTIGFSQIGMSDVLGVSPFDATFTGTYDDVSAKLDRFAFDRGRNDQLEKILPGAATLVLRDSTGIFNPANAASPLYGKLEERRQPLRLRGHLAGTVYPQFYGFIESLEWQPVAHGQGVCTISARDLLVWLDESYPVIASTGATTTGAAIGKVLDAIGWTDPSARDIDAGDNLPDFSADGSETGSQIIERLLDTERGVFFIAGSGKATFESRHSRALRTSVATITDQMSGISPSVDHRRVRNRVRVKRTQNAYVATVEDTTSQKKIGVRELPLIETANLGSDAQADSLASYLLAIAKTAKPPVRDLSVDNRTSALLTQALARELVDVVTVSEAEGDTSGVFHIERIATTVDPKRRHETRWLLSRKTETVPFRVGVSTLSGTHALAY